MKGLKNFAGFSLLFVLLFVSCGDKNEKRDAYDTPRKGTIHISVDESFEPVINEQIKVYQSSFPDATIIPVYKSEADCFRDLQQDSTRMIIVAKGLTKEESDSYKARLFYKPQWGVLAFDAVCVIVNRQSADSLFTMEQIRRFFDRFILR